MHGRGHTLEILGLSEEAGPEEIGAAIRALREHIEERAAASGDADFREARREELRDLERARLELAAASRRGVPRWVLAWALATTLISAGLIVYLVAQRGPAGPSVLVAGNGEANGSGGSGGFAIEGEDGGPEGTGGGDVDAVPAGDRAKLVVKSPVAGAALTVHTRDEAQQVVAEGAADETVYWLAPGPYSLEVSHGDCEDRWQQDLDARGGEEHEFAPEICGEVGWVVVRSNVSQDELSIDGQPAGSTGETPHPLPTGEHEVRVDKQGYRGWEGIVEVEPGRVLGIRPRLEPEPAAKTKPKAPRPQVATGPRRDTQEKEEPDAPDFGNWHEEARQWLLARYDDDRSGELDSQEELDKVPCEDWLGLEQSHDESRLGLSLTSFYGFDGNRWRSGALGVSDEVRDLAYARLKKCGLR